MITVLDLNQADQWDSIVRSFKAFDVYWLSGYVKAFQLHGDGEPLLIYYDGGVTRGINVVMKRDIAKSPEFHGKIPEEKYYDFSTPYGYGGWLIEGEDRETVFRAYRDYAEKQGIVSEFVRFHPMLKNHDAARSFYDVLELGEVVHMELSSPEDIWNHITSKNRNMIRKAVKNNVKVYNGRFPEIYEKFRSIYNATMDKDHAENYYYFTPAFYTSILDDLALNAQVFWAEKEGNVIAASIMIGANGLLNYHLSGSLREYGSFAPGNLILYEAALWGSANGYKTLLLGGGVGSGEDSLFQFKRSFYKGALHHFYIGKKIYNQTVYAELLRLREEIKNPEYFPKYRG